MNQNVNLDLDDLDLNIGAQKPRRKTVKRRIAATLQQLVAPQCQISNNKNDKSVKTAEIDQVCFCKYTNNNTTDLGDVDGYARTKAYHEELKKIHEKYDKTDSVSSTAEFVALMSISLPILKGALADTEFEQIHNDIKKSEVEWLVHFIEMILLKKDISDLEQNISISYFSCFLPIFKKMNSRNIVEDQIDLCLNDNEDIEDGLECFEWLFE